MYKQKKENPGTAVIAWIFGGYFLVAGLGALISTWVPLPEPLLMVLAAPSFFLPLVLLVAVPKKDFLLYAIPMSLLEIGAAFLGAYLIYKGFTYWKNRE